MSQPLILVADDEPKIRRLLSINLASLGYEVICAVDGPSALQMFDDHQPDLVLLDIMMPGLDGYDVLTRIRRKSNCAVILLTAKDQVEDKIRAFDLGADDYLPKPFHLAELNARIKSVIRRQRRDGEMDIRLANIRIVPDTFQVFVDDKEIELNRKEYNILLYFANRPGRLVNKNTLAESVWGDHIDQVDNFDFIYAQIKNLRKKLKDAGALAELKAVYGFGYKMTVE